MNSTSTSLDKQKKGNLYVYKFGNGNKTSEYQPPTAAAVTKRIISWGLRKSKSKPMTDSGLDLENKELSNDDKMSKPVSSLDSILIGLINGQKKEERKSISHVAGYEGKGKEFPNAPFQETRKSVSHVENSVAYVGKFVEKPRKSTWAKLEIDSNKDGEVVALYQVKVLVTDVPGFMQIHAFQCARITYDSLEKFSAKHLASNLKKEFDKTYGPAWHCIVGSSFGSFVTHATGCFLYFSMEKLCILLFRTKVKRAVQQ